MNASKIISKLFEDDGEAINLLAQRIGSACDIWMPKEQQDELIRLYDSGASISSKVFDLDDYGHVDDFHVAMDKWKSVMKQRGFVEFAEENNTDQTEVLMVKSRVLK